MHVADLFTPMLSWWQWLILASVPPLIIALYFLKLKRQPLEVPSTYLWQCTVEDLHVNSLWQRLRQSLLLFLQLLLIALIIFACLRPSWHGTRLEGSRFIFLVDTSASMNATDVGKTRLDEAKQKIEAMIQQMESGDAAMIISFSETPRVEQEFTNNRRLLCRRLAAIQPTQRGTRLDEALRVAAGLANPADSREGQQDVIAVADPLEAELYIFSDGKLSGVPNFSLGHLNPHYMKVGASDCHNVAIVAFGTDLDPDRPGRIQAYARLEQFVHPSDTDQQRILESVDVEILLDDQLVDAQTVEFNDEGTGGLEFELNDVESGTLTLSLNEPDDLSLDNQAFASFGLPRPSTVLLVSPGNDALVMALGTEQSLKLANVTIEEPDVLSQADYARRTSQGAYDLIIYDQCQPPEMPQSNTLFLGAIPPMESWSATEKQGVPQIIDTDRAHPIMQFVELGNVTIAESPALKPPPGSTVLIDTDIGPVFAIAARDGFEDAVVAFEIVNSAENEANTNWPIRVSFPLFVNNVLEYLGPFSGQGRGGLNIEPGKLVTLHAVSTANVIQVVTPSGEALDVRQGALGQFSFAETDQVGVYTIRQEQSKKVAQRFAVNIFDSIESNIVPNDSIRIGHTPVQGRSTSQPVRREGWKYLLLGALFVLLFEWYIFNRRVYL